MPFFRTVRGTVFFLVALSAGSLRAQSYEVASPDGRNVIAVDAEAGRLRWRVARDGRPVLVPSRLGFTFRQGPPIDSALRVTGEERRAQDERFTLPWGEVREVRDAHRELRLRVAEGRVPRREFVLVLRAFDDGVALRYEVPWQSALGRFEIMDELTEFSLAEDMKAWWAPADVPSPDRQEMLYSSGPVSKLGLVHSPLTLVGSGGLHAVIHEAHLEDYAGMYLRGRSESRTLRVELARWRDGSAVKGDGGFTTPWRTIQLADRAADLIPSLLTLKLNPPSRVADTRTITPMKYNGIWWGMHVNTMTWSSGPLHGATTANTRRYLDHAAANGLGGTLVEGWNTGWDGNWMQTGDRFSFTQPYPDFDLAGLAAYARERGVQLIAHNETATFIENYERQLDSAFALYARLGIRTVKTGYVNDSVQGLGHAHQGQYMVRHHRRVLETAARYGLSIVMHEPIKDAGERRTYPNMLSREGSRGMEFNAWGGEGGNPPEHETILPFTRLLSGPMDFTPGIFNLTITRSGSDRARTPEDARPRSTLAKQLALYVVLYSPVQMAADLIENYEGQPAFQFIRDVAVDWDETRVLHAAIGDAVVVARKAVGREEWFLGGITDEEGRALTVPTEFLGTGRWVAEVYADAPTAHWRDNPTAIVIGSRNVAAGERLTLTLAPGGGQAIRFRRAR